MAVNTTAIWRSRPSGSNTNGGGYDPGIAGAATDYSQQNAAQASGSHGTATGTTTFIDATANAFTAAMIGNAIFIASGAGFTVGAYFVTAFTSASTVTLDRSPGTGTVGVWKLGGGWADFWTNNGNSVSATVANNTVFVLGSGTPNPSSYVYDYTVGAGVTCTNNVTIANDPSTPGYKAPPDTTGGMPTVNVTGDWSVTIGGAIKGLYVVAAGGFANVGMISCSNGSFVFGCVFDQFGQNSIALTAGGSCVTGCEVFSSSSVGGSLAATSGNSAIYVMCNVHDTVAAGFGTTVAIISDCIIAKCLGDGIAPNFGATTIFNCTIDGNGGNGINVGSGNNITCAILNNIISNHTAGGTFGLNNGSSNQQNADYNTYYNNTSNLSGQTQGPHDTTGSGNPYVGQSTENYTLA